MAHWGGRRRSSRDIVWVRGRVAACLPAAALIAAWVVMTACASSPGEDAQASVDPGSSTPAIGAGQRIFASTCATCHGEAGQGQPDWHVPNDDGAVPPPPLNGDGHTWHHPDGFLYRVVSMGGSIQEDPSVPGFKSAMPAFGEQFSHEEIIETLEYVKSLWAGKTSRGLAILESQAFISERDPYPADGE